MQAYCVSKRPPRALFLALAIALGVVAASAAVLPMVGGGLMRDGTYVRLLGYTPSNRGATLTAQGAVDSSQSHEVLSASSAPGPTPAPPAAQVGSSSPSDAPAGSQSAPASDSDRQPDPVGTDVPALREVNQTRDDLANDSLDTFGFGVLPKDADHVLGAPDLMHFIAPRDNESGCTWKNASTATDANHDGNPEYVHGRMLGTCVLDANHNGVPEAGFTIARDFQVWDNDSDGIFNALVGGNGATESRGAIDRAAITRDANDEGRNETAQVNVAAYGARDRRGDGFDERARGREVSCGSTGANPNGFPQRVGGRIYLYARG